MGSKRLSMVLLLACIAAVQAAPPETPPPVVAAMEQADAIPGLREARTGVLTSGQPAATAWQGLSAQGVTTVVNLRPEGEMSGRDERSEVVDAGMVYHHVPIASAEDLTSDNAARLWAHVEAAPGRVLVHCASGNRAGALLAIGAAEAGAMSPEHALAFGKTAGLTSPKLEAAVRERLGLPAAPQP